MSDPPSTIISCHVEESDEPQQEDETPTSSPTKAKPKSSQRGSKRDPNVFRKAPQAPKRFKSSYIFFFTEKQAKIKEELSPDATVTDISRRSAEMWRNLSPEERAYWDEVANKDKQRYIAGELMLSCTPNDVNPNFMSLLVNLVRFCWKFD